MHWFPETLQIYYLSSGHKNTKSAYEDSKLFSLVLELFLNYLYLPTTSWMPALIRLTASHSVILKTVELPLKKPTKHFKKQAANKMDGDLKCKFPPV